MIWRLVAASVLALSVSVSACDRDDLDDALSQADSVLLADLLNISGSSNGTKLELTFVVEEVLKGPDYSIAPLWADAASSWNPLSVLFEDHMYILFLTEGNSEITECGQVLPFAGVVEAWYEKVKGAHAEDAE